MLIGLGKDKTPIGFGLTRYRSHGSLVKQQNKMVSAHYLDNYLSQSFHISHADWSWWGHVLYWIWFQKVKGQGHKGPFCNTVVSAHYLEKYLSQSYDIPLADWFRWGQDPFDFEVTMLKVKVIRVTCKKCTHCFCLLSWELFITELSYFT